MAAVTLIVTLSATGASAAVSERGHRPESSARTLLGMPRSETCRDARRGLRYYIRRTNEWRHKMGGGEVGHPVKETRADHTRPNPPPCARVRRDAKLWRSRAQRARLAYEAWSYQWEWERWLPDKFRRVGHCETGGTPGATAAGNFHWDSGRYVSFMGIYRPAYEAQHRWTGRNTPREQYEVAAAIQARFGWGAWGCGGA